MRRAPNARITRPSIRNPPEHPMGKIELLITPIIVHGK
jgi:hypothetical protein